MSFSYLQSLHKSSGYSETFRVTGGGDNRPLVTIRPGGNGNNNNGRPYKPYPPKEKEGGISDPVSATPSGDKNLMIIIIVCACAGVTVIIIGCAVLVVYMR